MNSCEQFLCSLVSFFVLVPLIVMGLRKLRAYLNLELPAQILLPIGFAFGISVFVYMQIPKHTLVVQCDHKQTLACLK